MAEDFIEEIYVKANVITNLKKMAEELYGSRWIRFKSLWEETMEPMTEMIKEYVGTDQAFANDLWAKVVETSKAATNSDLPDAADRIEELIPLFEHIMKSTPAIDVTEGDYRLFSSDSGYLSIENVKRGRKLVSAKDPLWEAYRKAKSMYCPKASAFCSLGIELGYLAWEIYKLSEGALDIYIYETDQTLVEYAKMYGVLSNIPKDKLHIVVDRDGDKLTDKFFSKHIDSYKNDDSIINIEEDIISRLSERAASYTRTVLLSVTSRNNYIDTVENNFYKNTKNASGRIKDIKLTKDTDEWVVVGGGPSVDYNIDYLKSVADKKYIIAASTIYKRLLNEGVTPDFICAVDMGSRTYGHLKDVEKQDVPLIISDSASWLFSAKYEGKKYVVPSSGYFFSEWVYKASGEKTWDDVGTVTLFCAEVALYFKAKTIELVGIDLAFPGGKSHASGTMDYTEYEEKNMPKVKSVTGEYVYTDAKMAEYIREFEMVISEHPKVRFVNRSKEGAYIKGCKNIVEEKE